MTRIPIHSFFFTISCSGFVAVVVFLPLGVRWWGFAGCMAELTGAVGWCAWAWFRSRPKPVRPRLDYARIAALEAECFPPCDHETGQWVWAQSHGEFWWCPSCPKPIQSRGRGAGSPTRR